MKLIKQLLLTVFTLLFISNCATDLDDNPTSNNDINDFIYRGLRLAYLYNAEVPDLVEDKSSGSDYQSYLNSNSPENFFENLIFDRLSTDRFSWLTSDYLSLEQQFQGVSKTNGMVFGLKRITPESSTLFGYIKYILPNTSASNAGLTRGLLFTQIDNQTLTLSNYEELLSNDNYTLQFASVNTNNELEENGNTASLSKQVYNTNPVFITNTFTVDTENVGYLMYNSFTRDFNSELNSAFATLTNVDQLVLDLRYNPGGSVNTAALLASMITGQFNGQVVTKLNYNENLSASNTTFNFTNNFDGETVNSLNLNKVYVLTTSNTASASEMIINSLKPYIEVVQIGTNSTGKSQASITLYDSPDFTRNNVNTTHLYAMQPLVAITVNKNDDVVPNNGLTPQTIIEEDLFNLGVLGDINEPLLAEAISLIDALNIQGSVPVLKPANNVIHSSSLQPFSNEMYLD
jgi:C-terminal processing protease CtpA/Prc